MPGEIGHQVLHQHYATRSRIRRVTQNERQTAPGRLFVGLDVPSSSALTRERLGGQPTQTGLIDDPDQPRDFELNRVRTNSVCSARAAGPAVPNIKIRREKMRTRAVAQALPSGSSWRPRRLCAFDSRFRPTTLNTEDPMNGPSLALSRGGIRDGFRGRSGPSRPAGPSARWTGLAQAAQGIAPRNSFLIWCRIRSAHLLSGIHDRLVGGW
jgi:hypothetical protein